MKVKVPPVRLRMVTGRKNAVELPLARGVSKTQSKDVVEKLIASPKGELGLCREV